MIAYKKSFGMAMSNVCRLLVLLVFTVVIFGCSKKKDVKSVFEKAKGQLNELIEKKQVEKKELDSVVASYMQVVEDYPDSEEAVASLDIIAGLYIKQNNYPQAIEKLGELVKKLPAGDGRIADVHFKIAQLYELQKNWSRAEEIYWHVANNYPTHVRGLYAPVRIVSYYGALEDKAGLASASEKAIQHYELLISRVENENAKVAFKNFLGVVYKINGKNDEALKNWEEVYSNYAENPYAPLAILASAELLWSTGDIVKAEDMYLTYFKKYPEHNMAGKTAMNLGLIFHQKKNYEKARLWYKRALEGYFKNENAQRAELKLLIGKTYQEEVMWEEANAIYEEIESHYGSSIAAMQVPLLRGNYFKSQGKLAKSNEAFDLAVNKYEMILNDSNSDNYDKLAMYADRFRTQALMDKGAWDDILLDIDKKIANEATLEAKGRWAFTKASVVEKNMNQPDRALLYYQTFLKKYPGHSLTEKAQKQMKNLESQLQPVKSN